MKQLRRITCSFSVLMLLVLALGIHLVRSLSLPHRDIAAYNDRIKHIYADRLAGASVAAIEEKYGCRILLSTELVDAELTRYYASGALVLDYAPAGRLEGKLVWDDRLEGWEQQTHSLQTTLFAVWALVLTAGLVLIGLVRLLMVRPIRELEQVADAVARGRLDVALPRRRWNLFGNFTESLDIMREELLATRERELQANKAKREMVAGLSHDIKTPVATIQAACEILSAQYGNEAGVQEKAAVIAVKAATIDRLISNLFHSTLEELEALPVNPVETNAGQIEDFFRAANQKGDVVLDNHIPDCLVYMDPIRMEQAVDNIVSNSRKYAGTKIHVSFDEVDCVSDRRRGARFVRLTIRDFGPGVPDEELAQITEKYYRGSNARAQVGYGLGMYLVRWYMEQQGGGMEYYNDGGFVVELLVRKV